MNDLTVILLTANKVPKVWADYHLRVLKKATQGYEWITLCREPVDFGLNDHKVSSEGLENIYKKVLRGAELAKTEYIATVEDDTLYHKSHFVWRPKNNVGYDLNRWMLFTWGRPFYFYKPMMTNGSRRLTVVKCAAWEYEAKRASAVKAAEPMAKPLPMAAVVLPTASS